MHNDDEVSYWYGGDKPSLQQSEQRANFMADSWHLHDVHKWIAYDRMSGELIGPPQRAFAGRAPPGGGCTAAEGSAAAAGGGPSRGADRHRSCDTVKL